MCMLVFSCRLVGSCVCVDEELFGCCICWYSRFLKLVWFCLKLVVLVLVRLLEIIDMCICCVFSLVFVIYNVWFIFGVLFG